jgi:hypothetical protein
MDGLLVSRRVNRFWVSRDVLLRRSSFYCWALALEEVDCGRIGFELEIMGFEDGGRSVFGSLYFISSR